MRGNMIFLQTIILSVFLSITPNLPKKCYIITYHTFYSGNRSYIDFSREELKEHMQYLIDNKFTSITLKQFIDGFFNGKHNFLLIIDDGNKSVYKAFYEVLKPMYIYPVIAMYIDRPASEPKYSLKWNDVIDLNRDGADIVIHGYKHRPIKEYIFDHPKWIYEELYMSKCLLYEMTWVQTNVYVFPYGVYHTRIFPILNYYGYDFAFVLGDKAVTFPIENKYAIPRIMLTRGNAWKILKKIKKGEI
jgi:hypothetical protein